jgi:hypothetical protein
MKKLILAMALIIKNYSEKEEKIYCCLQVFIDVHDFYLIIKIVIKNGQCSIERIL